MHVTAIIAAGGRGERFGGSQPKQLLAVGGRPILERSVAAFLAHPSVDAVVVALPQTLVDDPPEYLRAAKAFPPPLAERATVDAPKPSAKVGALLRFPDVRPERHALYRSEESCRRIVPIAGRP